MKLINILFALILLLASTNVATAIYSSEAAEIPYQIDHSDRIIIGTVTDIQPFYDYTIVTIGVDEWLTNPLSTETITVRTKIGTNFWTEDEPTFALNETIILMLEDVNINEDRFGVVFGEPGKHPISDKDAVLQELAARVQPHDSGGKIALDNKDPLLYDAQIYAQNNNISTEEALRRFQFQDIAGKLDAELSMNEPETFAGLWVEHNPKFKIVVQFTRDGGETIKPYLKQYTELADIVEVHTAKVSLVDLQKAQANASDSARALDIPVESGINVYNNSVELYVTKSDRILLDDALQRGDIQLPDVVRVITVEANALVVMDENPVNDVPANDALPNRILFIGATGTLMILICAVLLAHYRKHIL
ncbi:MAG: hypothetical protein Q7J10_04785 [Methanosarcinaceae archaeon]|nr:hypothetical protein [Methanosarcinaceae archaeon]